ncbi:hypothetical protein DICPUDRAFT_89234 [Dictyostelium purpureum]|uniref:Uncharacterized protein n=1 Tax=Dictyostelium purpureum TaxID=5786 RepID=F0ZUI3_DICPU|nr:uncharacterized protein DICPUDRAFT_89234 [Dictyostelium purpureum]EGC32388.1 hypothetical protein DICPUDRAFT_89234 [Dictyostelium purpureum]|eukprot:XP_003291074.1 hypothetical protein DICPUDRAFT_89234 [Dictyostelium purpureum]
MDKKNIEIEPKTEAINMYKHIVCEAMYAPNSLPVHLSEPFNINVEFIRISSDWVELELLDKKHQTIDKIKLNTITSVEPTATNSSLNTSGGSNSPMLTRSNSILNRGVLGSNSSSDDLLLGSSSGSIGSGIEEANNKENSPSPNKNSKASALLGLDEQGGKKEKEGKGSAMLSPKFGLLARSASNNLLKVNEPLSPTLSSSPANSSFLVSSSPLSISGSPVLSSSTGSGGGGSTLNISPSNISSPRGSGLDLSSSVSSSNGSPSSLLSMSQSISNTSASLHYNQGFTLVSSSKNFTFNAADKDSLTHILNSIKMISLGRLHQEQLQQTFDAIVESIQISQLCKIPPIPPLPSPPPPPPTILLLNSSQ